jgi:hypothetical protein
MKININLDNPMADQFLDVDIEGCSDIHRAKVPNGIEKGDIFNIYRGESTKEGCEWVGNLEESLIKHIEIKTVGAFLEATGYKRGTNHPKPSELKAKMEELNVTEDAKIDIMSFFLYDNESTD